MLKKATVLGSINYDIVASADRLPKKGETVKGSAVDTYIGGKGSNQAVQMALLGLSTTLIAQVGNDEQGKLVIEGSKKKGVDVSHFNIEPTLRTGCAVIYVAPDGSNMLVHAPGANHTISQKIIDSAKSVITSADIFICQTEINLDALMHGLAIAHKAGIPTVLNPAPAVLLPEEIFSMIDYIVPNETESEFYTHISKNGKTDEQWRKANAQWFLDRGVKNVCITLGEKGSYFTNGKEEEYAPPFTITPVDTTAAGDSFIGGFTYGLVNGWPMERTLQIANACGALASTIMGAQNSIQEFAKVQEFMRQKGVKWI